MLYKSIKHRKTVKTPTFYTKIVPEKRVFGLTDLAHCGMIILYMWVLLPFLEKTLKRTKKKGVVVVYKRFIKRLIDVVLSGIAIAVLALPMLVVALIIKLDSAGPVLFKQKRIGIHKKTFTILKFRSMPTTVPKDMPTHQFEAKDQLSKWQKFMRKASIDELPQIYNIFVGDMSICGPRPALWNQDDLIAERDKYRANDVKPGLTGWAQINGRDELGISQKAKLDGEYVAALEAGEFKGFAMDVKCLVGTVFSVLKSEGVVEGGTGELAKEKETVGTKK